MFAQDYFIGINAVNPIIFFSQVDGNKKPIKRSLMRVLCPPAADRFCPGLPIVDIQSRFINIWKSITI
jgi:hypothetical protein